MRSGSLSLRGAARWVSAGAILIAAGGCLPDNAIRTVLSENLFQTLAFASQGFTNLLFGIPDNILNSLVNSALASLLS